MHNFPYVGHLGYQKTIAAVKTQYYWPGMKKEMLISMPSVCMPKGQV